MPTAIETWRERARQEREDKRRARLREQLPMGNFETQMITRGTIERIKPIKKKKFKKFEKKKKLFGEE